MARRNSNNFNVGVDVAETSRFEGMNRESQFLMKNFTGMEINYCFSYKNFAMYLAGTFSAKEAIVKALGGKDVFISDIEIRHNKKGQPEVWIKGKAKKTINISISHTNSLAVAVAVKHG